MGPLDSRRPNKRARVHHLCGGGHDEAAHHGGHVGPRPCARRRDRHENSVRGWGCRRGGRVRGPTPQCLPRRSTTSASVACGPCHLARSCASTCASIRRKRERRVVGASTSNRRGNTLGKRSAPERRIQRTRASIPPAARANATVSPPSVSGVCDLFAHDGTSPCVVPLVGITQSRQPSRRPPFS
jgi:hypothetical protein